MSFYTFSHPFSFVIAQMIKRAQRAEHLKELGILDSSMNSLSSGTNSSALYYGTGLGGSKGAAGALPMHSASVSTTAPSKEDDEDVRAIYVSSYMFLFCLLLSC